MECDSQHTALIMASQINRQMLPQTHHNNSMQQIPSRNPETVRPAAPQTGFFSLPIELRTQIYAYILTKPNGLHTRKTDIEPDRVRFYSWEHDDSTLYEKDQEANQLRYVCRQMYYDTNALAINYNVLHFNLQTGFTVYEVFSRFVNLCSPAILARLKKVVIFEKRLRWKYNQTSTPRIDKIWGKLQHVLDAYSQLRVFVDLKWSNFWHCSTYGIAGLFAFINDICRNLRGASIPVLPIVDPNYRHSHRVGRLIRAFKFECPPNLRFRPPRDLYCYGNIEHRWLAEYPHEKREEIVEAARMLWETGM